MALRFRCAECGQMSSLGKPAGSRDDVHRLRKDAQDSQEITFYCDTCGAANAVTITPDMIPAILSRLSSDDAQIQKAIDDAKEGNYDRAIGEALRRFKF
jgi:hypothetical protein